MRSRVNPRKPIPPVKSGGNWRLFRNILIIIGLLVAIYHVSKYREHVLAEREHLKSENVRKLKEAREKNNQERKRKNPNRSDIPSTNEVKTPEDLADSTDQSNTHPTATSQKKITNLPPEIISLNSKATELIDSASKKRVADLAANAKSLAATLDARLNSLPKAEQERWEPFVTKVKSSITQDRVTEMRSSMQSDDRSKIWPNIVQAAVAKQSEIDNNFVTDARKIHTAYLRRLEDATRKAEATGMTPLADSLKGMLAEARDFRNWLRLTATNEISNLPKS